MRGAAGGCAEALHFDAEYGMMSYIKYPEMTEWKRTCFGRNMEQKESIKHGYTERTEACRGVEAF